MELGAAPASAFSQTCGWSGRTKADLLDFTRLYYSFIWTPFLVFLPIFIKMLTALACGARASGSLTGSDSQHIKRCLWLKSPCRNFFLFWGGLREKKEMNIPVVFRLQS